MGDKQRVHCALVQARDRGLARRDREVSRCAARCDWADERDQFHARSAVASAKADTVRMGVCKARESVKITVKGIQGKNADPWDSALDGHGLWVSPEPARTRGADRGSWSASSRSWAGGSARPNPAPNRRRGEGIKYHVPRTPQNPQNPLKHGKSRGKSPMEWRGEPPARV